MNVMEHRPGSARAVREFRKSVPGKEAIPVAGLDEQECQLLKSMAHPLHCRGGQLLFEEGEESHSIFFVHRGKVEVGQGHSDMALMDMGPYGFVDLADCDDCWVTKQTLGQGSCVGELSTLEGKPHHLSAKSVGESDLLELDTREVKTILQEHPHMRTCLMRAMMDS